MLDHSIFLPSNILNATIILIVADSGGESIATASCRAHLALCASQVANFTSQTRHKSVLARIVRLLLEIPLELVLGLFLPLAQGVLQELLCTPLLHGLLFKDVLEEVFIALDESLRIDLPMLDLLFAIPLDPLEQCLETLLVLLS